MKYSDPLSINFYQKKHLQTI